MNDRELDIVLENVGRHAGEAAMWKDAFHELAQYYISLIEGDDIYVDSAHALLKEHGIVDEDGVAL